MTAHVFLKATCLSLGLEEQNDETPPERRELLDTLVARTRAAFFEEARDISELDVLLELLEPLGMEAQAVRARIDNGEAYAALHRDEQLIKTYGVLGSPTYVFNEGRQLLYGNVGYRIIESNVRELLSPQRVEGEPSWC
jgi:predicted DsbA family dithiol-disulfide isomerase